ncbi:MAG: hypothetical protein QXJ75_02190 [Candidatus Bathyarchaeia archaeon]
MRNVKPPVGVKVKSLESFARLSLAIVDSPPLLWHFKYENEHYLGVFSVYMFWKGDIPLFAYIPLKDNPGAFLAYRSDGGEECLFTDSFEDTRYVYAPVITLKDAPDIFRESLMGKRPTLQKPLTVELDNLYSMMRLLFLVSTKEYTSFPIWHFKRGGDLLLGVCIPFEHFYEANALPVFFYLRLKSEPRGPFLRYMTAKTKGETLEYARSTGDTKFFYAKIIDVEDMPLFKG